MEKLKYITENYKEQADAIKREYPKVDFVFYKVDDCSYLELKQFAFETKNELKIWNGKGEMTMTTGTAFIKFSTKPLIVSEPVIIEE